MDILTLLEVAKLIPTRSEGRRLIDQGGVLLNGEKVTDFKLLVTPADFKDGRIVLKKGKKAANIFYALAALHTLYSIFHTLFLLFEIMS